MKRIMLNQGAFKKLFLFFIFAFTFFSLRAAWVENLPTTVVNPDGTELNLLVSGDEFFNFLHDENGYTIIAGDDGYYYYAQDGGDVPVASPWRVGVGLPRNHNLQPNVGISEEEYQRRKDAMFEGIETDTYSGRSSIHEGTMNNIVIYIRFADDTEFTTARSVYDTRFNGSTAPSVKHYFQEVSYGKVSVESHHFPPSAMNTNISYQDIYPRSYYQPYHPDNNPNGYTSTQRTSREHQLLDRAVKAVEHTIPQDIILDSNNNGRVDNVSFIIKGSHGTWASILWAHRWMLFSTNTFIHGKRVWDFTFQPESQSTVTILNHELFHTFGAPDLYRYSNNTIVPVGPWDLMHSGSGHMGAFMKWKYTNQTWISDIPTISEPGTYTLNPLTSPNNNAYRINSPNSDTEYFVVEYRRKQAGTYDNSLPNSGLLIYRINTLAGNGNANGPPDEVYLYRPNGTNTVNGTVTQAHFSSNANRTSLTDQTSPSGFLSNNALGGLHITNITEAGNTISFDLGGVATTTYSIALQASPSAGGTVTGGGNYGQGQQVTVTASANDNYIFENWTENGNVVSSNASYSFTVSGNRTLVANFEALSNNYTIALNANPTAGGQPSGAGTYTEGHSLRVQANPNSSYNFVNWTENGSVVSTNASYTFNVQSDRTLRANYALKTYTISLSASPSNGGSVTGGGTFNHGSQRSVNAFPADGFEFVNWTENGNVVSTNSQYTFQLTSNRSLVANFSEVEPEIYTVSTQASPTQGGNTAGAGEYEEGSTATLTATAAAGYTFTNWTAGNSVVSSNSSYSFTVTSNRSLTANFSLNAHTITLNASPTQGGSTSGAGSYNHGQTATVTATAADGYTFTNWTAGSSVVSTNSSYSFTVTSNRSLTANFALDTHTIAVNASPSAGGNTSGAGTYNYGQTATVTATAADGYTFTNWTAGSSVVSTNSSYSFTVTDNRSLTANFSLNAHTLTLNASPTQGGSTSGAGSYDHGQTATVTATAADGYTFTNWTAGSSVVSSNSSYSFTVTGNRSLTANFSLNAHTLTLNASPTQGGSTSGAGSYDHGQTATVTATAADGYTFTNWTAGSSVVSSNSSYSFTVTGNRNLTANFSLNAHTVTLNASPTQGGSTSGAGSYNHGQTATVTASPAQGYTFTNWTENGSVISSNSSFSFTVEGNRSLTANFSTNAHTLTLNASPTQGGSTNGAGSYNHGQTATVTASPAQGYTFTNWTENGSVVSSNSSFSFTVEGNRSLTANFSTNAHTLTLNASPTQGGSTNGAGSYNHGQTATVTASPAQAYTFTNWTENGSVVSSNSSYSFTVNGNRNLTANFTLNAHTVTLNASPTQGGSTSGAGGYNHGQTATVTASPAQGYTFTYWTESGSVVSFSNSFSFTVEENRSLMANFEPETYGTQFLIEAQAIPGGHAFITGAGYYDENETVTLTAIASTGSFTFEEWTENGVTVSTANPYVFTATEDRALRARFRNNPRNFTVSASANHTNAAWVYGSGTYEEGEEASVEVAFNEDVNFIGWQNNAGQIVSRANPFNFTVTSDIELQAVVEMQTILEGETETIRVYPNPTTGRFFAEVDEKSELFVRNLAGVVVYQTIVSPGDNSVNLSFLPTGMYLLQFHTESKVISGRIVVR